MEFLDNIGTKRLGDALSAALDDGSRLSVISTYFTVFAYGELKDELSRLKSLRFVFSEPTFIKRLEDEKPSREFELAMRERERGIGGVGLELTLRNNLNQRALARACADWVRDRCEFRSPLASGAIRTGDSYVVERSDGGLHAFTGADCPFTQEGLGYERRPGTYTNIYHFVGAGEAAGPKRQFEQIWNEPGALEDITAQVAERVGTLYRENAPEYVYYLTLYHLFRDYLESAEETLIHPGLKFEDSVVWNRLYDFQKDAVVGAIRKLEKYQGCIIADSVGLGKTFEALAVIKYYQERNARVLVLAPKRLRDNWTLYKSNDERNVLAQDRLNYDVLNHTDLSRFAGKSGEIDLSTLRWGNYDLLVIDESHNFRNKPTDRTRRSRYDRLMEDVIRSGIRTKVLMLSATPVNNRLMDLRNQIEIITEGDDAYLAETDGIPSINLVTRTAQQRFAQWSKLPDEERTTKSFANMVNPDYFKLLDALTIARSRKHVARYYGGASRFPQRRKPLSLHPPIDALGEMPSIKELNDMIASLAFAQYQLLSYVRPDARDKYARRYAETWGNDYQSQVNRTTAVANLIRVNLLKRMESSIAAFRITLTRILAGTEGLIAQLDALEGGADGVGGEGPQEAGAAAGFDLAGDFDDPDDAEEFEAGGRVRVDLRDVDALRVRQDAEYDAESIRVLLAFTREVTPERDAKLATLRAFIADKVANPYNEGNRKVLVFSAFADTVSYLFDQLAGPLHDGLGLECAQVTGSSGRTYSLKLPRASFDEVLARFSPRSKELKPLPAAQIDVLFATDCISEGQNLQDCDCVVNYDIHWNPVRIIQRFGRIDRLGSANECIQLVNFWPDIELDEYIRLESRVKGRMVLLDASATGEENVLEGTPNDEMNDLLYRRRQLQTLQEEVLDLEDITGGISITDFAFEDFRVELQRYVQAHPGLLEGSPAGLHAVAKIPPELAGEVKPGVVFCLKHTNLRDDPRDGNPLYPCYLVHVGEGGEVAARHVNPKETLDVLRGVCAGRDEADRALCAAFNRRTKDGTDMGAYSALLERAVADITGVREQRFLDALFELGEADSAPPATFEEFSLVSMVVLVR